MVNDRNLGSTGIDVRVGCPRRDRDIAYTVDGIPVHWNNSKVLLAVDIKTVGSHADNLILKVSVGWRTKYGNVLCRRRKDLGCGPLHATVTRPDNGGVENTTIEQSS